MNPRLLKLLALSPLILMALVMFIAAGGWMVMSLWNWLTPPLFGWRAITFWQGLGLLALCRILFGGLGLHSSGQGNFRRRMEERWERMSPEERERFRQGMGGRWGWQPPPIQTPAP